MGSLATVRGEMDKAGVKPAGHALAIFLTADDNGFTYRAEIPIAAIPEGKAQLSPTVSSASADGKAMRFEHRGAYDDIDATYEAITAYLDEKGVDAQDSFIEEYVNDVKDPDDPTLQVYIYVLLEVSRPRPLLRGLGRGGQRRGAGLELKPSEAGVEAVRRPDQRRVRALLDDAPASMTRMRCSPTHRRQAMGDDQRRAILHQRFDAPCTSVSLSASSAEVASSRSRTGASLRRARAIARRWRSPPDTRHAALADRVS